MVEGRCLQRRAWVSGKELQQLQKNYKNKRVGAKWWKDSVLQSCHSILAKYFIKHVGQMGR